jgi:CheY-like chemotaxis protein
MAEAEGPAAGPLPEQAAAVKGRRGRVLVVDDDPAIATLIARVLSSQHEVRSVLRASEAIDLIAAGERFDVVLSDLMMPQVTGMDLYSALVALDRAQAARVVFMTGGAFSPEARAFLDQVPSHRIEKPFEIGELRALVSEMLL